MNTNRSCSTCAFMRTGKVRDHYSRTLGKWITHDGALCRLYPPYKGIQNPVEPNGICSRWTDAETLEQPLAHLCPQTVLVSSATQTTTTEPDGDTRSEVDA